MIFTRNTTDATNLLARSLPEGTTAVVFDTEHHASLLPWERALRLPVPAFPGEAVRAVDEALASIEGPKLLVVTAASNVTGELWPIAALAHIAHRHGARVLVDAAQLVPHRRLNLTALDLDYVVFSGHKLYAPFGTGALIGRSDWLADAEPYLRGGGAVKAVNDDETEWHDDPEIRHEAGTPNVLGAIALAAACDALTATGWSPWSARRSASSAGCARASPPFPACRSCPCGVLTTRASASSPSWCTASPPARSPRPCPATTASASATASSAPTPSCGTCWMPRTAAARTSPPPPCAPPSASAPPPSTSIG